jgi:hypothetical protein
LSLAHAVDIVSILTAEEGIGWQFNCGRVLVPDDYVDGSKDLVVSLSNSGLAY